ncbi:MAG: MFS transporter [Nocardioidaceae bacterium]
MNRARLITAAAFAGNLGWGAILPYQYAYVVNARHWGSTAGALTGTLFCIGAVAAAPFAGRLADRYPVARLAVAFELVAALACVAMGAASTETVFLAAMLLFGAAVTAAAPATQVLVLECVEPPARRAVFAYQFTAMALGMGVGSFVAGWLIDFSRPDGMVPAFAAAALGFVVSAAFIAGAARTTASPATDGTALTAAPGSTAPGSPRRAAGVGLSAYRTLARDRPVRLFAVVSMLLAAGFYAQFETGLPAFALQSLRVAPSTVGIAAAVNCLVIVALQWLVVKVTGKHPGVVLLGVVGSIWVLSWLLLEVALFTGTASAGVVFVVAFGMFAIGETMYAPVLSPLAAAIAPAGLVGTTLGLLAALRTGISAAGPLVAGVLISAGLPQVFVLLHVAINLGAVAVAARLWWVQRCASVEVDNGSTDLRSSRV